MRYVLLLVLAGCATTPRPVTTAQGDQAFYVECRRSMTYCMDAAEKTCPGGFVQLDSHRNAMVAGVANANGGATGSALALDMTYRCR
jgi:hypothetical protein